MRRAGLFLALTVPVALWAGVSVWAQSKASGWTPALGELSLSVRVALASQQWATRLLPFAIIPVACAWPLILPGIALLTRNSHSRAVTRRDVATWWCISVVAFGAMLLMGGVVYFRESGREVATPLLACLGWMGIVAFWVSLGTAYGVQQIQHAARQSTWHPRELLAGLAVLNCVGLYALPLLAVIAFRKSERAVEQGDEADKA
jgi:hypothetical protein